MDLSTMRTRLRERVGNPDTTDVPNSTLTLRINEAAEDIWDNFKFHANRSINTSINTVAGTVNYNLPTGTDIIMSVRDDTNKQRLSLMTREQYDELPTLTNGKPLQYFRAGNVLYLNPPPDAVYNIRLRARVAYTALSLDADTPTIPTSWHNGIVLLARYKFWESKQNAAQMATAYSAWTTWLETKTDEIAEEIFYEMDQAVRLPELEKFGGLPRLDFDHSD